MFHIQPAAGALSKLLPFLDISEDALPTELVKLGYAVFLNLSFAVETKSALYL